MDGVIIMKTFLFIEDAISREKQLKHWNREWKLDLIKTMNPTFKDLYSKIV
jgi:putative endonuclease